MVTPRPVQLRERVPLGPLTTLGVGGDARFFLDVDSEEALLQALAWAESTETKVVVLGGGSNVLISDRGVDGLVLRVRLRGVEELLSTDETRVAIRVGAGEELDSLVERCVRAGHAGVECLSGIPGYVGATPIQNVGAYGQEVARTIVSVRALERASSVVREFDNASCRFAYRTSVFKQELGDRYIVLSVTFSLSRGGVPEVRYPELSRELALRGADPSSLVQLREIVLAIRRAKSMVLDPTDPNGKSAGSFFVNPVVGVLAADRILARARALGAPLMPRFPQGDEVKLSAAWLIEQSGFAKGTHDGPVGISSRHALALVNRGGATAGQIVAFAARVRRGVRDQFGVSLAPEPILLGFSQEETRELLPSSAGDTIGEGTL